MTPMMHPMADVFLLGLIVAASLVAALFFLRFWRDTKDTLFLAFAVFFIVQGGTSMFLLSLSHPNEGSAWVFLLRLGSVLSVLAAILWKNTGKG